MKQKSNSSDVTSMPSLLNGIPIRVGHPKLVAVGERIRLPVGIFIVGLVLYVVGTFAFNAIARAPSLDFGGPGMVHFEHPTVTAGTEPMLCFDAIEWKRLCPGNTFTQLTPVNVSDAKARAVDLEVHPISTPRALGRLPPKCRATKIPAGLAPGVWKLTGHATSNCTIPWIGAVEVTSLLPDAVVVIKAQP